MFSAVSMAGMSLGRLLSGLLAAKLDSWKIIRLGQIVLGIR